jgi:hypothetical protein
VDRGNQGLENAVGGGTISGLAQVADGILNFPADVVAMQTHTPPACHISLSGAWDHLWEKRTGIQAGSLNDWMLHKTSTAVSIATLLIPGIDAVSGIADTLRGASEARALAAAAEASGVRVAPEEATGQIGYGSTDLSRAVQDARITAKDVGGNYAAGRLEDGTIVVGRSSAELHAEQDVIRQAGGQRILDIYSEREPCAARCAALTQDMNVTWSWPWNPPEVRQTTNADIRAAIGELFR